MLFCADQPQNGLGTPYVANANLDLADTVHDASGTVVDAICVAPGRATVGTSTKLALVFYNGCGSTANANTLTVKCTLYVRWSGDGGGFVQTYYPLTFGGQSSYTMNPGEIVVSDQISVNLTNNPNVYPICYFSVPTGGTFPRNWIGTNYSTTDATVGQTNGSDPVAITTGGGPGANQFLPGPIMLLTDAAVYPILGSGDSIMHGTGDTNFPNGGLFQKFALAIGQPFFDFGEGGTLIQALANDPANPVFQLAKYFKRAISQRAINDFAAGRTASQILADRATVSALFRQQGCEVWETTLTPQSTSTDGWTTTTNQTASFSTAHNAVNDGLRQTPATQNRVGLLDVSQILESALDSGKWTAPGGTAQTGDGTHPNSAGHQAGANGLTAAYGYQFSTAPVLNTSTVLTATDVANVAAAILVTPANRIAVNAAGNVAADVQTIKTQAVTSTGTFSFDAQTTAQTTVAKFGFDGSNNVKSNPQTAVTVAASQNFNNTGQTTALPITAIPNAAGMAPATSQPALSGQAIEFAINYPIDQQFSVTNFDATNWTQVVLTVKANPTDADIAAKIAVKVSNPSSGSDGLITLNGAAPSGGTSASDASLSVTTATSSALGITFAATARGSAIAAGSYFGELTVYKSSGKQTWLGIFDVIADPTVRANPTTS